MTHRITLLALEGCFASNIVGAIDLFNTANLLAARAHAGAEPAFRWQVLSPKGSPVRASSGCTLNVDGDLDSAPAAEVVMVPAFGSPQPRELFAALERCAGLAPWLKAQYQSGATIAASCSGSFLLAECGLLDGRRATTSWWLAPAFQQRYARVDLDVTRMVTDDERVLCSGAGMSHLDLSLYLIEKYAGRELAHSCARFVVLDDRRRSQAPYIVLNHACTYDPLVVKAENWIKANLRRNIRVEDIADHVAVSARTLARRFRESTGDTPQEFVQKLRVETCKALLENTRLRFSEILDRVGYQDESTFRRLFKKYTNLSPRDYRQRFGVHRTDGSP